jgi:hypothetical protein
MDDEEAANWQSRLTDELLPYTAFYGVGLLWLIVSGSIAVWGGPIGFFLTAGTIAVGGTIAAMVTLLLLWRVLMLGVDEGQVMPMVAAGGSAVMLITVAIASAYPAAMLGRSIGELQVTMASALLGASD